jgi:uncharacterized protein DUF5715
MTKRIVLILLLFAAVGVGVWLGLRFARTRLQDELPQESTGIPAEASADTWDQAVEKVKADRGEPAGVNARVETPPELKHYEERHWFLATQVAEVARTGVHTCQDYMDLAAMIERGEMVTVPAFTDTYILFGIGQRADDDAFSRYTDDRSIEIYDESHLKAAYKQLDDKRTTLKADIASLKSQATKLTKRERSKQRELQKQITADQAELNSIDQDKAELDEIYGNAESRQRMFHDYESLQSLAKNFAGRSFDLNNSSDRQALKMTMLSSVRPPALKVMEEVAAAYHAQFGRRLPVSSLVRPEQYQRALRRVNRNAVLIDTPPHSTGLAFDIDFRYMTAAEQSFVMDKLAELKRNGRIEVIRERNANYHVFAFLNGTRPNDDLITASLEDARGPEQQTHHATAKPKSAKLKKATKTSTKSRHGKATTVTKRHKRRR